MGFPLYARFAHPDGGWAADQARAAELLTAGKVYTVRHLDVGRSSSTLELYEFPGVQFNTVLFEGASYRRFAAQFSDETPAGDGCPVTTTSTERR